MKAYYNENEKYAVRWLKNLVTQGLVADGDIDDRSILDVTPSDLAGYGQCHFFAGIGGWSHALRLAGWPDDKPAWTGSCPCQPFSASGKRGGFADERHLWPAFHWLIENCRPAIVFGEQVASADGLAWFDLVSADLEGSGYASGAADLCAAGVGAPHVRQRLWWTASRMEDSQLPARPRQQRIGGAGLPNQEAMRPAGRGVVDGLEPDAVSGVLRPVQAAADPWNPIDWLACRDGKWRGVEPGTFPLAHGVTNRVGRLRAYGNAIVPQVAAEFIKAVG